MLPMSQRRYHRTTRLLSLKTVGRRLVCRRCRYAITAEQCGYNSIITSDDRWSPLQPNINHSRKSHKIPLFCSGERSSPLRILIYFGKHILFVCRGWRPRQPEKTTPFSPHDAAIISKKRRDRRPRRSGGIMSFPPHNASVIFSSVGSTTRWHNAIIAVQRDCIIAFLREKGGPLALEGACVYNEISASFISYFLQKSYISYSFLFSFVI